MKLFVAILLLLAGFFARSQSVYQIRADTVKILKVGGSAELVLLNSTKDSTGILVNMGNGLTKFLRSIKINDSTFVVGKDTISLRGSSGGEGSFYDSTIMQSRYRSDTARSRQDAAIAAAGAQSLNATQSATKIAIAISGGNSQDLNIGTTNLAGLIDTARIRWLDSAKAGQLNDTFASANGIKLSSAGHVTTIDGDSLLRKDILTTNGDLLARIAGVPARVPAAAHAGMKLTSEPSGGLSWRDTTAGGGGSGTDSSDIAGYGISKTISGNNRTYKADTGTTGTSLKKTFLPLNFEAPKTINQGGFNSYITGGGQVKMDSFKLTPVQAPPSVLNYVSLGNSITFGQGASIIDSNYRVRVAKYYSLINIDLSLSGSGVWKAASNFYANVLPGHLDMTSFMAGFNDVRRNGAARPTLNKVINCLKAVFVNHFLASYVNADDASVTHSTGFAAGYQASTVGGKVVNHGLVSSTLNDSAAWTFTGTNVAVGLLGADGSGGNFNYAAFSVYIDGVRVDSLTENLQWDGISDGVYDNKRGPMAIYYTGLSAGTHKIVLYQRQGGNYLAIDYFGKLVAPIDGKPLVIMHAPRMNAAGYATSPNLASNTVINTLNSTIDSVFATFPAGYPVYKVLTNNYYDTLTGLSGDNIHPNNTGYRQIFNAFVAGVPSFGIPATEGTVYYGNDGFLYASSLGLLKKIPFFGRDSSNYVLNQSAYPQFGGFNVQSGTATNLSATTAALGATTVTATTPLTVNPSAGGAGLAFTNNAVTGFLYPMLLTKSVSSGVLLAQQNTSQNGAAYSAISLYVGGNGSSSAYTRYGNFFTGKSMSIGLDPATDALKVKNGYLDSTLATTYLSILQTGKVGILNASPARVLDVTGEVRISDSLEVDNVRDGTSTDSIAVLRQISTGKFALRKVAQSSIGGSNAASVYVPASTTKLNAATVTADSAMWSRNGNNVSVDGAIEITASTSSGSVQVYIPLPVPSPLVGQHACWGQGNTLAVAAGGSAATNAIITGDITTHSAVLTYISAGTSTVTFYYHFTYIVQ